MPCLADPITLQGTVEAFDWHTTTQGQVSRILLIDLEPRLLDGKDHVWVLQLAALAGVHRGDRVEVTGRPTIYVRRGRRHGTLGFGLSEPRHARVLTTQTTGK